MKCLITLFVLFCSVANAQEDRELKDAPLRPEIAAQMDHYIGQANFSATPDAAIAFHVRNKMLQAGWVRTARTVRAYELNPVTERCTNAASCWMMEILLEETFQRQGRVQKFTFIGELEYQGEPKSFRSLFGVEGDSSKSPRFEYFP